MKSFIITADDLKVKQALLAQHETTISTLKDKIEYMRAKPQILLTKSEMPIAGISVDEEGNVLVNKRPIVNLSGGERIKFVMNIVRATVGDLVTILVNGFESLSLTAQEAFIKECTNDGYQYVVTKVNDSDLTIKTITEDGKFIDAVK